MTINKDEKQIEEKAYAENIPKNIESTSDKESDNNTNKCKLGLSPRVTKKSKTVQNTIVRHPLRSKSKKCNTAKSNKQICILNNKQKII